jgi:hypothetical protein
VNIWGTAKGIFVIVKDIKESLIRCERIVFKLGKLTKNAKWLLHGMGNEIINSLYNMPN